MRLPKEFRMPGTEVTIRPMGRGVLIEPKEFDYEDWLARLREYRDEPFMEEGPPPQGEADKPDPFD